VLTIDQLIQYRTEQALQAAVERSHAKSGTAIVMDPRTGNLSAGEFADLQSKRRWKSLAGRETRRRANIYEPGSTFRSSRSQPQLKKAW